MPFPCEKCKKSFRDRYDLNRHLERKNPCVVHDTSGVTLVNNGTINGNVTINIIKNETLSPDLPAQIIDYMRETLKLGGEEFDYIRAVKWITNLHKQICRDPNNHNIILKNIKDMTTKVLTEQGWVTRHTNTLIDEIFKIRSSQLIELKEAIQQQNPKVLTAPTVKRTMGHVSAFQQHGFNHQSPTCERLKPRSEFKVALLN
jgi:hypothetical protein